MLDWGCRAVCGAWLASVLPGSLHLCSDVEGPGILFPCVPLSGLRVGLAAGPREPGSATLAPSGTPGGDRHVPLGRRGLAGSPTEPCGQARIFGGGL